MELSILCKCQIRLSIYNKASNTLLCYESEVGNTDIPPIEDELTILSNKDVRIAFYFLYFVFQKLLLCDLFNLKFCFFCIFTIELFFIFITLLNFYYYLFFLFEKSINK